MKRREFLRALTGAAAVGATTTGSPLDLGGPGATSGVARAAAAAAAAADAPAGKPATTLRVMTFNIHHAEGTDGKVDLDRVAKLIRSAEPDVVCLQEVDKNTTRTGKTDQAAKLGELTKMWTVFGKATAYQGGEYGVAILSRHELVDPDVRPLPGKPGEEKRCLLTATAKLPGGRTVRVAATHLNHRNSDERVAQAKAIVELLSPRGRKAGGDEPGGDVNRGANTGRGTDAAPPPTLLAGDFNAEPGEPAIKVLAAAFTDVSDAGGGSLTWPDDKPRKRLDYVFAAPPAAWRLVKATVIDPRAASDHRAVLSVVELVGGAG